MPGFGLANSDETVKLQRPITIPSRMDYGQEQFGFNSDQSVKSPYQVRRTYLEVRGLLFPIAFISHADEGFIVRVSTQTFSATGQGETHYEALQDIKSAIELLLEEEENPSRETEWPEDYQ